jgi:hypothetical protein
LSEGARRRINNLTDGYVSLHLQKVSQENPGYITLRSVGWNLTVPELVDSRLPRKTSKQVILVIVPKPTQVDEERILRRLS